MSAVIPSYCDVITLLDLQRSTNAQILRAATTKSATTSLDTDVASAELGIS